MKLTKCALTVKFNTTLRNTVKRSAFDPFFEMAKKYNISLSHLNWEIDSELRLHFHAVAEVPINFYRKKLKIKGFMILCVPLPSADDLFRWVEYCYKDCPPEDWPDDIPPRPKEKTTRNLFKCCNNNDVTIKT